MLHAHQVMDLFDRREPGEAPRAHAVTPPPGRFHLVVEIPGKPVPKARARIMNRKSHGGAMIPMAITPDQTIDYENRVRFAAKAAMGMRPVIDGPVRAELRLYVAVPQSFSGKKTAQALAGGVRPTTKPDIDNVAKSVLDACNGIVWEDDTRVCELLVTKHYATEPGAVLEVWAL